MCNSTFHPTPTHTTRHPPHNASYSTFPLFPPTHNKCASHFMGGRSSADLARWTSDRWFEHNPGIIINVTALSTALAWPSVTLTMCTNKGGMNTLYTLLTTYSMYPSEYTHRPLYPHLHTPSICVPCPLPVVWSRGKALDLRALVCDVSMARLSCTSRADVTSRRDAIVRYKPIFR